MSVLIYRHFTHYVPCCHLLLFSLVHHLFSSFTHYKHLLLLIFCGQKLSYNSGSNQLQKYHPGPDKQHPAAGEAAKQMKTSSFPSPLPFKMVAAVSHMPACLGHFSIAFYNSSLQLPGLPFCFNQINAVTLAIAPARSPFPTPLFTANNYAIQTPIRLNELQ